MLCAFILLAFVATSMSQSEYSDSYSWGSYSLSFENRKPCFYRGDLYYHGEEWIPLACAKCICLDGNSHCKFETCPTLECDGFARKKKGVCCAVCEGTIVSETPVDYCYWRGKVYDNEQTFSLNECTDCTCSEGTGYCVVRSCPPLPPTCTDPQTVEGECCPVCS